MAAVTQRIHNYLGGVSRQADDKKLPGQVRECINAYPDPTFGLTKRPGLQWITNLGTDTTYDSCKWFYIHRDNNEKYIGCIKPAPDGGTGGIDIWNAVTGAACTVNINTDAQPYLTGARTNYDILTVQDTSIITNNLVTVAAQSDPSYTKRTRATLIFKDTVLSSIFSVTLNKDVTGSGSYTTNNDLTITVATSSEETYDGLAAKIKTNLVSLSTAGTVYKIDVTNADTNGDYFYDSPPTVSVESGNCQATAHVIGGRVTNITVTDPGDSYSSAPPVTIGTAWAGSTAYEIGDEVTNAGKVYLVKTAGTTGGTAPTHESGTATDGGVTWEYRGIQATATAHLVTNDNRITGLTDGNIVMYDQSIEIDRKVGTDRYPFSITGKGGAANNKLIIWQDQVDNVSKLPINSFHNHIVKIVNTNHIDDTYYAKFKANDLISGDGFWEETLAPDVSPGLNAATMPHELINTSTNNFIFKQIAWTARLVGDDKSNSHPSFVGNKIQQAFFHSNRLGFLSGDNVSLSQAGSNHYYNFYHSSAQTITDADPVDLSCSAIRPAVLHGIIPTTQGLVLFSKSQQFLMSAEQGGVLTPTTTTISTISNYEMDTEVDPVDTGTDINFISKTPSFTRIFGMITKGQRENPEVLDIGKVVNEWIPPNIDTFVASPHNQFLAMSSQSSNKVYFYRTYSDGDDILIQAWFNWELPGTVQNITVDQDAMFAVTKNGTQFTLSKASLSQSPDDAIIINHRGDKVNPCVDLYATASSVTFNTIDKLNIISPGAKYDSAPTVTIGIPWATDTAYKIGDQVINGNKVYTCTLDGQSNSTGPGPSGTLNSINDNSTRWAYAGIQATATATVSGNANDKTVTALKITNPGSGYTRTDIPDFVTISPAPSSNAGNARATASATKYNGSRCFLPYNNISTLTPIMVIKGTTQTGTFTESGFTITPDVVIDKGDVHFTVPYKDLTSSASDVVVGWKYNLDVTLPRTYFKTDDNETRSDFTAPLIIKRMKFAVGLSGVMGFKLKTTGRLEGSRTYTADGRTTAYSWLKSDLSYVYKNEIKVKINDALTSNFTVTGDTQVTLNSPSSQHATMSGDNNTKVFDLTFTPTNPSLIKVEININDVWVEQASNTYHLVKNYIHFDSAPAAGSGNIFVYSADTILIYTDEWHNLNPIQKAGTYLANDVPLDDLSVFTIPIHQKTENFVLRVVNDSPFPVSLNSMMWEGNYSPRFYRRT